MGSEKLRNIRTYLFRHGRYLDCARWNYHFEDGSDFDVLRALKAYQNSDGGFGHGLEPDNQNPNSTPLSSWAAVRILREIGFPDLAYSMINKLLFYLEHSPSLVDGKWRPTVDTNNDFPHAPWWTHDETKPASFYPTVELASFIIRCAKPDGVLYVLAESIVQAVVAKTLHDDDVDFHGLSNLVYMVSDLKEAGRSDLLTSEFEERLFVRVSHEIDSVELPYQAERYGSAPKYFVMSKSSPFYAEYEARCRAYADFLEASVDYAGFWEPSRTWGKNPLPDEVRRQWRSALIVENMLYLQGIKPDFL
jgi:hypothetical protein